MKKIVTVVGARPQFIKASRLSCALQDRGVQEKIIHTGQHFDQQMSAIFFDELQIPKPAYSLGIGGLSQGAMTGRMMEGIEKILVEEKPDAVLVYGDTNSTMAGAVAASKMGIPVAHIEAGMRSYNKKMAEEINRTITDHLASLHFCTHEGPVENLRKEGIREGIHCVGDIMFDCILHFKNLAPSRSRRSEWGLGERDYGFVTLHRRENLENRERLQSISKAILEISKSLKLIFPVHPHTRKILAEYSFLNDLKNVILVEPTSYLETIDLESHAKVILTDSGGVQKEAYFCSIPCVTMRDETEWIETLQDGWNTLAGANTDRIISRVQEFLDRSPSVPAKRLYGDGTAGLKIARILSAF